ncbi:hypothetical protein Rsub_10502 [Raphidocelis subcapitata]|uniref:CARDB domain-containing protein n=1 Tax=Raphidocelis subcapitata TaxID=307507 RepID=A0A2V0PCQ7_9CHLO|nr:hypothetical protein Rsub_10502 [Raphidocelis subcapitata]|eukprot:GBF97626.1 hypothetical protein Rsub_10502 [Raphidocelis subcapitata]
MAAVRALAALLVLVAVGAALADDEPRMKPARIVSRFEQQKPGPGATQQSTKQFSVQSFTELPLSLSSDWIRPIEPEAGKKQQATFYITNAGEQPVPAGTICGERGDVDYKLPELLPLETKAIKASWKVPDTPGGAVLTVFIDSACTVFNQSDSERQTLGYTVVPTGTKYAFLYRNRGDIDEYWDYSFEPQYPVRKGTFQANVGVVNLGTAPSEAGVMMAVYYDDSYRKINTTECTHAGQVSVELPKIAPGKVKVVPVEGLKAADDYFTTVAFFIDATCKLAAEPVNAGSWTATTTKTAGALLGGVQAKGQLTFTVKTSPKKPKANDTMTVKVKITNLGDADGSVGRVNIYTSPVASFDPYFFPAFGLRCDLTDFTYSFNTTDLVIKAGKSKTVKITDVPVPAKAGWSGLVVVPDAGCTNAAETGLFYQIMPFITFEAVAP